MIIKNVGPRYRGGVEVGPTGIPIAYNGTAEVDDTLGAALCAEQPDAFQEVDPPKPKKGGS